MPDTHTNASSRPTTMAERTKLGLEWDYFFRNNHLTSARTEKSIFDKSFKEYKLWDELKQSDESSGTAKVSDMAQTAS
ncbi:uncharacterized protein IL334_004626 [Kwoniella shivajii]|uniref:Uncharacterized protein n=1 Tax=Kwoniella shivajii TaxID=564305 RepID=A0ABZ1D2S5_9TREE|nr:hypothetical protein IL334_004626 [Kwoniella shivajii]